MVSAYIITIIAITNRREQSRRMRGGGNIEKGASQEVVADKPGRSMNERREMSSGAEAIKLAREKAEQLAAEKARLRARAVWGDFSIAIGSYSILTAVILLRFQGFGVEVVAPVAILGLAIIFFRGSRRGKRLYKLYYEEELHQLQELSQGGRAEVFVPSPLTPREREILDYIARGYINKQIAGKLGISEQTIKNHMSSILRKLDASDRTQAVVLAMRSGWISPEVAESSESSSSNRD